MIIIIMIIIIIIIVIMIKRCNRYHYHIIFIIIINLNDSIISVYPSILFQCAILGLMRSGFIVAMVGASVDISCVMRETTVAITATRRTLTV